MKTNKNSRKRKVSLFLGGGIVAAFLLFLTACIPQKEKFVNTFQIYYVNNEETGVLTRDYQTNSTEAGELAEELLSQLSKVSEKLEYRSPLAGNFSLLDYKIAEDQIILSFNDRYREQPIITETLVRAALVRTLTQIKGIQYVSILIRSDPLLDSMGNMVGVMSGDMFIDDAGKEINAYDKIKLRLYWGNESGDGLVGVTRSGVVYNSNVAMEKMVVEHLIAGPLAEENAYATMHPDTKVIGTTVKDGTCYVNLSDSFLSQLDQVSADVTIYSITNSLVELPNVNKVQISVNGNAHVIFKESVDLSRVFERNLDIVKMR